MRRSILNADVLLWLGVAAALIIALAAAFRPVHPLL